MYDINNKPSLLYNFLGCLSYSTTKRLGTNVQFEYYFEHFKDIL